MVGLVWLAKRQMKLHQWNALLKFGTWLVFVTSLC